MKQISWIFFIVIFLFTITSCQEDINSTSTNDTIVSNKKLFIDLLGFVQSNQRDSLYKYILNPNNDTIYFDYNINSARRMLSKANFPLIVPDSIIIKDSTVIPNGHPIYNYSLNLYDSNNNFIGDIVINFHVDYQHKAVNFYGHEKIKSTQLKIYYE